MWTLGEILNEQIVFKVPFYQRGYRWTKKHVKDLLNDLYDFYLKMEAENLSYYSLQPLVLKQISDKEYIVVDGQQRLTTLLIILYVFEDISGSKPKAKYEIKYERPNSEAYLRDILKLTLKDAENNPDFWYMFQARETIYEWIKEKELNEDQIIDFMHFIRRGKKIYNGKDQNKNIRFIKYLLTDDDNEFEVFIRLNIGKIKLTNAELIKSYILSKEKNEKERLFISQEWDEIEYTLQDNEFFSFLTNKSYKNRIELIFQIYLNKKDYKDYELYEEFVEKTSNIDVQEVWLEIKRIFRILHYWNRPENLEYYHLIGLLTSQRHPQNYTSIIDIYQIYKQSSDYKDFMKKLKLLVRNKFEKFLNFAKEYKEQESYELFEFYSLTYGDSKRNKYIEDLLLLFNIASIETKNNLAYTKFSFYHYNHDKWSIEHITPKIEIFLEDENKVDKIIQKLEEENLIKDSESNDIHKIQMKFTDEFFAIQENKDLLFNLTLMPASINSALKNNFFPIKRKLIIDYDKKGAFIPLCTKNVFLKYYTQTLNPEDINKWTEQDAKGYINSMIEIIQKFLKYEQ